MFERATRECAMSPMIVTVRPSNRPFCWNTVSMSSSAWVGCSWAPSPALITGASSTSAIRFGTPATACRTITHVGVHRVQGPGRVEDAFLLGEARRRGGEVDDVRRQALARDLEARLGARGRLEEEVHDGASAQGRHLLDVAGPDLRACAGPSRGSARSPAGRGPRCRADPVRSVSVPPPRTRPRPKPDPVAGRLPRGRPPGGRRDHRPAPAGPPSPRAAWECSCPRSRS